MKEKSTFNNKVLKVLSMAEDTISCVAFVIMCFVVLWSVICRYVLHRQFGYGEEMARYFMVYAIFIGISIGVRKEAHLGVEAFVGFLPNKAQTIVKNISKVLCVFLYAILCYLSIRLDITLSKTTQLSPALHLPMWIPYLAMPIGLFLSTLRAAEVAYLAITGKENADREEIDV